MCFSLAPGYVLKDDIARELVEEFEEQQAESDDGRSAETPSFASDDEAAGAALTGEVADDDGYSGGPR